VRVWVDRQHSTEAAVGAVRWAVSVGRLSTPVAMCCVGEMVWESRSGSDRGQDSQMRGQS
jgi:hypothetical protein